MTDRGYSNFYTPDEYDSYQQYPFENYGQTPYEETPYYYPPEPYRTSSLEENRLEYTLIKFMEMSMSQNQKFQQEMQQMQQENQQYQKQYHDRLKNLENQLGQIVEQLAYNNNQGGTFQTNTQTNPDEKENNVTKNEECGECVEENVEKNEEERIVEGCGVAKIMEEIETPHIVELPHELPNTKEANTVDNEEVMIDAEVIEGLFIKKESCEQKRETENKAEIDRVIDEICALFNKKELGRIWAPQHLLLKFMEFLPNQRKKTDDVLSVSFWPP